MAYSYSSEWAMKDDGFYWWSPGKEDSIIALFHIFKADGIQTCNIILENDFIGPFTFESYKALAGTWYKATEEDWLTSIIAGGLVCPSL